MEPKLDAYLDIETTGLSWLDAEITVIGLYLVKGFNESLVQLVGKQITVDNLLKALRSVQTIFSYNGTRFDLPFINASMGLNLSTLFAHNDLMYDCWRCNLYGGLKAVEQQLGICRQLQGLSGFDAVKLWQKYRDYSDQKALALLLRYNKADVMNLRIVKERLGAR